MNMYYKDSNYLSHKLQKYKKMSSSYPCPVRNVLNQIFDNTYKFGDHLQYVDDTIDIKKVLDNIDITIEFNI